MERMLKIKLLVFGIMLAGTTVAAESVYIVKDGDTLWSIARAHGLDYGQLAA